MVDKLNVPITAKIRIFDDEEKTIKLCQNMESVGVSMITVHGRTVNANKLFVGSADWNIINKIKSNVKIPVVANGGISCYNDVDRCFQETNADGVMSSEALLENPKLFLKHGNDQFYNNYVENQLATADEYLTYVYCFGNEFLPRIDMIRSHLFKILYRFMDAPKNADLRRILAEKDLPDMVQVVIELKNRLSTIDFNTEKGIQIGYIGPTIWYMRHRDSRALSRIVATPRQKKMTKDLLMETKQSNTINLESKLQLLRQKYADKLLKKNDDVNTAT